MDRDDRRERRKARREERRQKVDRIGYVIGYAVATARARLEGSTREDRVEWVVGLLNRKIDLPLLREHEEEVVLRLVVSIFDDYLSKPREDREQYLGVGEAIQFVDKLVENIDDQ